MALSNWDTLAVDLNGKPQSGTFISPGGVEVRIYKNWIYVSDPAAWREGGSFVDHTVMEIQHGSLQYHDVHIEAIRGLAGIYVACWHINWGKEEKETVYTGMIGCGVYGFEGEEWVGVLPENVEFLQKWISHQERTFTEDYIEGLTKVDSAFDAQSMRESFHYDFPDEIAKVSLDQATRFNQGDMYFADRLGQSKAPVGDTKPGEAGQPTIMKIIDHMRDQPPSD